MRMIIALVILVALIGACEKTSVRPTNAMITATTVPLREALKVHRDSCHIQLDPLLEKFLQGTDNKSKVLQAASTCIDPTIESSIEFAMSMQDTVYLERLLKH